MADRDASLIEIGTIVSTFGLDGTVKIASVTDFPERFKKNAVVLVNDREYHVERQHWHREQVRVKFREVTSIEQAQSLIGRRIKIEASSRPKLPKDEFYVDHLIGLLVQDQKGTEIGTVTGVESTGVHDVLIVGEHLIPVIKEFVKKIDLNERLITVELIPNM